MSEDEGTDDEHEVAVGDRYRIDDGTSLEVAGVADGEVDVVQYDADDERLGEYTTSVEEFREDVADLAD